MGFRKQIPDKSGWWGFSSKFRLHRVCTVFGYCTTVTTTPFNGGPVGKQNGENSSGSVGYGRTSSKEGRLMDTIHYLDVMDRKRIRIDSQTYAGLLQGCVEVKAMVVGKRVHDHIIKSGFEADVFLGNNLVSMYARCGSVMVARQVFEKMPTRNIVSWNAMIAGCAQHGHGEEALKLFWQMQKERMKPNKVTFVSVLNACARPTAVGEGKLIHAKIVDNEMESDVIVGTALVNMYSKCACIDHARQVFNKIHKQDVVSWTTMIAGYAQHGHGEAALKLFRRMQKEGPKPNKVTFSSVLNACASPIALAEGKLVHACIVKNGMESDIIVGTALVTMYSKCASMEDALHVFEKMSERDVISWNAMIAGFTQYGHCDMALRLFWIMQTEGVKSNCVTLISVLNACASLSSLAEGKAIHAHIVDSGMESDIFVRNALIDMYAKCGSIEDAVHTFAEMPKRDVVSWTAMIGGYAQHGHCEAALEQFRQMQKEGVKPNGLTFISILLACSSLAALAEGKLVHAYIVDSGMESDGIVGAAVLNMYCKCGSLEDARRVFNKIPKQDISSWNSMIIGYSQHGCDKEALGLFQQLQQEGLRADEFTFSSVLSSCASLAALAQGKQVHSHIIESGFESNISVGNALVDMYAKCGSIHDARQMFDKMCARNVVSWNAMIAGCAQHGLGKEALDLFQQMKGDGMKPDPFTFGSVLTACSHAGMVDKGCHIFHSMSQDYGITPTMEHYADMFDLLNRAGCLSEAENIINKMPCQPNAVVWMSLLGACRNHGNVELAERATECVLQLEPGNAAAYLLLANIYATFGRWHNHGKLRKVMEDRGFRIELDWGH